MWSSSETLATDFLSNRSMGKKAVAQKTEGERGSCQLQQVKWRGENPSLFHFTAACSKDNCAYAMHAISQCAQQFMYVPMYVLMETQLILRNVLCLHPHMRNMHVETSSRSVLATSKHFLSEYFKK